MNKKLLTKHCKTFSFKSSHLFHYWNRMFNQNSLRKRSCRALPENRVRNLSNPFVNAFIITSNILLQSVCIFALHKVLQLFMLLIRRTSSGWSLKDVIFALHFLKSESRSALFLFLVYKANNHTGEMEKLTVFIFFWYSTILPFSRVLCALLRIHLKVL